MRLIDADAFLENNKELADCDFIHPKYCDTLRDLINNAPTVCDIEQIRAEIEKILDYYRRCGKTSEHFAFCSAYEYVLAIIDKYTKGEQE